MPAEPFWHGCGERQSETFLVIFHCADRIIASVRPCPQPFWLMYHTLCCMHGWIRGLASRWLDPWPPPVSLIFRRRFSVLPGNQTLWQTIQKVLSCIKTFQAATGQWWIVWPGAVIHSMLPLLLRESFFSVTPSFRGGGSGWLCRCCESKHIWEPLHWSGLWVVSRL